jgi:hypothetical protein
MLFYAPFTSESTIHVVVFICGRKGNVNPNLKGTKNEKRKPNYKSSDVGDRIRHSCCQRMGKALQDQPAVVGCGDG